MTIDHSQVAEGFALSGKEASEKDASHGEGMLHQGALSEEKEGTEARVIDTVAAVQEPRSGDKDSDKAASSNLMMMPMESLRILHHQESKVEITGGSTALSSFKLG